MSKAPDNYCQLCWDKKVVAPANGPTCPHNNFDWKKHFERLSKILGKVYQ